MDTMEILVTTTEPKVNGSSPFKCTESHSDLSQVAVAFFVCLSLVWSPVNQGRPVPAGQNLASSSAGGTDTLWNAIYTGRAVARMKGISPVAAVTLSVNPTAFLLNARNHPFEKLFFHWPGRESNPYAPYRDPGF